MLGPTGEIKDVANPTEIVAQSYLRDFRHMMTNYLPNQVESQAILTEGALAKNLKADFGSMASAMKISHEAFSEHTVSTMEKVISKFKDKGVVLSPREELAIRTGSVRLEKGEKIISDETQRLIDIGAEINNGAAQISQITARVITSSDFWIEEESKKGSGNVGSLTSIREALLERLKKGDHAFRQSYVIQELLRKAELRGIKIDSLEDGLALIYRNGSQNLSAETDFVTPHYLHLGVRINAADKKSWQGEQDKRIMNPKYITLYNASRIKNN